MGDECGRRTLQDENSNQWRTDIDIEFALRTCTNNISIGCVSTGRTLRARMDNSLVKILNMASSEVSSSLGYLAKSSGYQNGKSHDQVSLYTQGIPVDLQDY
jgi:hypothetical protein